MKKLFLFFAISLIGCSDEPRNSSNRNDGIFPGAPEPVAIDLAEIRKLYPERYKVNYRLKLATPDSMYHFYVRHYCLYDSSIAVPARYNFDTNDIFVTHSFETEISIVRGSDTLAKRKVTKADLQSALFPAVDSFGVMLPPVCKVDSSKLVLNYSISIPVTDVGVGVSLLVDTAGNYSIRK